MPRRKRREGEVHCTCGAYPFTHRQMGGACNGAAFVEACFAEQRECRDCPFKVATEDGLQCQVLEGLDSVMHCPALRAYIRYHGIKLYGVNR